MFRKTLIALVVATVGTALISADASARGGFGGGGFRGGGFHAGFAGGGWRGGGWRGGGWRGPALGAVGLGVGLGLASAAAWGPARGWDAGWAQAGVMRVMRVGMDARAGVGFGRVGAGASPP